KPPEWWEKQKGSRGIRRGQWYRLVFQFPIRQACMRSVWIFEIIVRLTHHTLMLMYAYISINDEGKE
ncbi:hypothetical protein, partial [Escherichia coli]|uniref:hypothetical protein n=1 Tax=Escherichia coli TaxID=562 RepID=UPI001F37FDB6